MYDDRLNQIHAEMQRLTNIKRGLREREKSLDARARFVNNPNSFPANNVKGLRNSLLGNLPNFMMPGNVGGINEVTWPFLFNTNINIGTDPQISSNAYTRASFQVDQEACFLILGMSIAFNTDAAGQSAVANAPLQIEIVDRQSSRRFNDKPMPIQMIGTDSCPSVLPVPMYVQPNAFIDFIVNGIPDTPQPFNGSGSFQVSFFGNRIRIEDAGKVLSTIFQPQY